MTARLALILAAFALASGTAAAVNLPAASSAERTAVAAEPTFVITGRGWGHGVGMSQYGALGFARQGMPYTRILSHYYPGTQLTRLPATQMRVLLAAARKTVTLSSRAAFRVRDAEGKVRTLAAGELELGPGLKLSLEQGKEPQALPGPLTFLPGSAPLRLTRPYRGALRLSSNGKSLQVVNLVGLELYLRGVVPDEVPDTWPPEALKAQAVAARSYAMATRKSGGTYDVYDDTRSQVYGGVDAESFTTTAAVDSTAGQVLTYGGRTAITYFFSTSGGRTAAVQDAWPGARPVPYLVSVPDPYDTLSPHHRWGPLTFGPKGLLKKLRLPARLLDLRTRENASGRVSAVVAVSRLGELELPGTDVRRALGLRSTWFRVGVLSLERAAAPVVWGSALKLTGIARGLSPVSLEQRVSAGVWEPASRIEAGGDGRFAVSVKPRAATTYRLSSGKALSAPVSASVSPLVRLSLAKDTLLLRGTVRPVLPGLAVTIQRQAGTAWTTIETVKLDKGGNFTGASTPQPGTYRARISPAGFATGLSPVLKVSGP